MKSIFTKIGTVLMTALFVMACNPVKPVDETENKLHEDPKRAELTLIKGQLQEDNKFIPDGSSSATQKVVFAIVPGKGWQLTEEGAKAFTVEPMDKDGSSAYYLDIKYYSPSGELMNNQFIENGQDNIHRHFFSAYKPITDGAGQELSKEESKTPNLFVYDYLDTTPWNKQFGEPGVSINKEDNYLGFKGIFRFFTSDRKYNLRIRLMHAIVGKNDKGPSTYYAPNRYHTANAHWDVDMLIPLTVK
ncbi:hypothetical protein [Porphyromonas sp.]|uniref:hypothetical protein n=1 Tax=Porphyromonas sp. TaxID=1924944 RepID=UPI0026DA81DD|nr:hypothetical protein [Porphyromonas sp.]MDO4695740.1 hypothetical protein [Porphyromonas sp.]MDO4771775.1 hypothetical protein [Porphyromonas sp.]